MGKMIDAQSIMVACAACYDDADERSHALGPIFRKVWWHSVVGAAIIGLIALLQAYVFTGCDSGAAGQVSSRIGRRDPAPRASARRQRRDPVGRGALAFVERLHRQFEPTRQSLLAAAGRTAEGVRRRRAFPDFLPETAGVRAGDWKVASTPPDLEKRWVEITGPVERKMMINALNSGRRRLHGGLRGLALADLAERRPGQANLIDAVRRPLAFTSPEGKAYRLNDDDRDAARPPARLAPAGAARPRGRGADLGVPLRLRPLRLSQRARAARARHGAVLLPAEDGEPPRGPALERRLPALRRRRSAIPRGTFRATVLIETLPGGLRDGRDPLRAARALERAERRALGLPLLDDQDAAPRAGTWSCPTAPRSR